MSTVTLPVPKNLLAFMAPNKLGAPFVLTTDITMSLYIQLIWGKANEYGHVIVYNLSDNRRSPTSSPLSTHLHGETNKEDSCVQTSILYYIRFMVNAENDIEIDNIQGQGDDIRHYLTFWHGTELNQQKARMKLIVPYMMYYLCSAAFKASIRRVISLPTRVMEYSLCGGGIQEYVQQKQLPPEERNAYFKVSSGQDEAVGYYDRLPVKLGFSKVPVTLQRKGTLTQRTSEPEDVFQFIPSELGLESMALAILKTPKPVEVTYGPSASYIFHGREEDIKFAAEEKNERWADFALDTRHVILASAVTKWSQRYYEHLWFTIKWTLTTINHKSLTNWPWCSDYIWPVSETSLNYCRVIFVSLPVEAQQEIKFWMETYNEQVHAERQKELGFDLVPVFFEGVHE